MKKIQTILLALVCMSAFLPACGTSGEQTSESDTMDIINMKIDTMTMVNLFDLDPLMKKGVSAAYAGVIGDELFFAGGCNFPYKPNLEYGEKVYYKNLYKARIDSSANLVWEKIGELPKACGYGITIASGDSILIIGGCDVEGSLNSVWRIYADGSLKVLSPLPVAIDNMAGAMLDNKIYVVGGNADGKPSNRAFALDISTNDAQWEELPAMPGNPRVQPVCAAASGKIYVFGGFAGPQGDVPASMSVSGLCYDPATKAWAEAATPTDAKGESVSLGGGAAVAIGDKIVCAGGVNKDIFLEALNGKFERPFYLTQEPSWYKFNRNILVYDTASNTWEVAAKAENGARAGAAMVAHGKTVLFINGELMPGIRTPMTSRFAF